MDLTVARFDLDHAPRAGNTPRSTPDWAPLPTDFPFLVDVETGEVVRPVLLHLEAKFNSIPNFKGAVWTSRNSADAAAADLRDWFIYLHGKGEAWDNVSDRFLARYLKAASVSISPHTEDFLAYETIARRCSSIDEFHKFAKDRWPSAILPGMDAAKRAAGLGSKTRHHSDDDPHPIPPALTNVIADLLGPLPRSGEPSSARFRLAFELGLNVGMRIDEIVSLRADAFDHLGTGHLSEEDAVDLGLKKTKGLVARTVHVPVWLVREIRHYIEHERDDAAAAGRALRGEEDGRVALLLNPRDARAHAGKGLRAKTIDAELHRIMMELPAPAAGDWKPRKRELLAAGSRKEKWVEKPAHTFHDARHTYAYWTYLSLREQGKEPFLYLRTRLGHRQLRTTVDTYLTVFNELGSEALAELTASFSRIRAELTR